MLNKLFYAPSCDVSNHEGSPMSQHESSFHFCLFSVPIKISQQLVTKVSLMYKCMNARFVHHHHPH